MKKKCTVCGIIKPLSEYHKSNGHRLGVVSSCKKCVSKHQKGNRKNLNAYMREWYKKNIDSLKKYQKRWRKTNTEKVKSYHKKCKSKQPLKNKARDIFIHAVYRGKVERPNKCSSCGGHGKIEGHHHDYSRPLDVVFLCTQCHNKIHRQEKMA